MIMSAHMCEMDWNAAIGLPNAVLFLAYSMAMSASIRAAPTICVHSSTVARSIMSCTTGQPRSASPTKLALGTRTFSNVTSLCLSLAMVSSGMWDMPGLLVSTTRSETPSLSSDLAAVRTTTRHLSATTKLSTNILVPFST